MRRRLRLAADATAPARARRVVETLSAIPDEQAADAVLLISEVVTNAVRHGSEDPQRSVVVSARIADGVLRVDVEDEGGGFKAEDAYLPRVVGGWGLRIVDQLADRWGVATRGSHRVWFELDLRPSTAT